MDSILELRCWISWTLDIQWTLRIMSALSQTRDFNFLKIICFCKIGNTIEPHYNEPYGRVHEAGPPNFFSVCIVCFSHKAQDALKFICLKFQSLIFNTFRENRFFVAKMKKIRKWQKCVTLLNTMVY